MNNQNIALLASARSGNLTDMNRALSDGANVNYQAEDGWTALHFAACHIDSTIAQVLIAAGSKVNIQDNEGATPLHNAAYRGYTDVAQVFIDAGANVDIQDNDQETPLHWASWSGHKEVVLALCKADASVNALDKDGSTPLHRAAMFKNTDAMKILIGAGSDVEIHNSEGESIIDIAAKHGPDMLKSFHRFVETNHFDKREAILKDVTSLPFSHSNDSPLLGGGLLIARSLVPTLSPSPEDSPTAPARNRFR